jgi:hypothetical protein
MNFEVSTTRTLIDEIKKMIAIDRARSRYGYCVVQYFDRPDFSLGTIDRLDVPHGTILEWDVPTVICCDKKIVGMGRVFFVLVHTARGRHVQVETSARPMYKYLTYQYAQEI